MKVSNILRDIYLVDKSSIGATTAKESFERESGKSGAGLQPFIMERSLRFARPWFAKKAVESRGGWFSQKGWTKSGILDNTMNEFDDLHGEHEKTAAEENGMKTLVSNFLLRLNSAVK